MSTRSLVQLPSLTLLLALALACTPKEVETKKDDSPLEPAEQPAEKADDKPAAKPPTEPPPTEPKPATDPLPPAVQPGALPFYLGHAREQLIEVQAGDMTLAELAAFPDDATDGQLKPDDARIPARFAAGSKFVVVSESGRTNATLDHVYLYSGGDGLKVGFVLKPESAITGERGILAFPAASAPADAKVRLPESVDASDPVFTTLLANAGAAATAAGGPAPKAGELNVRRATLHGEGRLLFSFRAFGDQKPEDVIADEIMSGFGIADAKGTILDWIEPAQSRLDMFDVQLLLDLEGDGVDEVIYQSAYYEGAYQLLLRQVAGKIEVSPLAGDGA